jgi:cytochrome c oxidase subunit 3
MEHPPDTSVSPGHEHPPHLAHHFDTPQQQFQAGALGMWLFLATEILLFSGLFCAYAVYRALNPEVFLRVDEYLDKYLGALNTVILLCSSFTMALAVWAAQRSRQKVLVWSLVLTLLGGCGFMGVKFLEYKHKWEHHLLWGAHFAPDGHGDETEAGNAAPIEPPPAATAPAADAAEPEGTPAEPTTERWDLEPAGSGPRGLLIGPPIADPHGDPREIPHEDVITAQFFAIYFAMTGLHGLHVLAGMVVIAWLLARSIRGHFGRAYYNPVELGGLYWHLVDLIWIYLFPLLYLIH